MAIKFNLAAERFEKAARRAVAHDFERKLDYRWTHHESGHTELLFLTDSASHPGTQYGTRIFIEDGRVTVTCNCDAGTHGQHPCWHMAAALMLAGFLAAPADDRDSDDEEVLSDEDVEQQAAEIMREVYAELDYYRAQTEQPDDLGPIPF